MYDYDCIKGECNIKDLVATNKYRREFSKNHPDYFNPDGLILFCGGQGAGKTLSAVRYLHRLMRKYPAAVVISNISLDFSNTAPADPARCIPIYQYKSISDVQNYNNGYAGIIVFIDEIQIEFASMESAKTPPSVLQTISQQRKRRLHIIGTTQLFKRVSKPFREQCNAIVDCSSLLGGRIQKNAIVDLGTIAEDSNGNLTTYDYSQNCYWFRSKFYFDMYDTSKTVKRVGGGY